MLEISAIKSGIVIDHIEQGHGYQIFKFLKLHRSNLKVALIMNVDSKKSGKKDLIKVENIKNMDFGILGLFSDTMTVNFIENEKVVKKIKPILPDQVKEILECKNPRCISNHERNMVTSFTLINRDKQQYVCDYCEQLYEKRS